MRMALSALLALAIIFAGTVAAAADTIKLGTLAPEGSPWHTILRDMAEAWKAPSCGAVELRIYPGGVAGDEPDMIRKMRIGQLHAAALTGSGLSKIAREIQALQMPMMLSSYGELDHAMAHLGTSLEGLLEDKGFKVLNWSDGGWVRFFTQQPMVTPEDLRPLKIFVWAGDPAYVDAWKAFGYRPVPLAATEIHTGLQTGLINALPTTPIAALAFQWFGLAKHMTALRWAPLIGATVVSTKAWAKIPDEAKACLVEAAHEAAARSRQEIRALDGQAIAVMQKHGLVVHAVPSEVAAIWEANARKGYASIVGKVVPAEMVAKVERLRNDYRAAMSGR